ncbi:MAG: hypothetical protein II822_10100 [Prevotella sp.]|nr:hypothetical protein [Prevotella sp.]
MLLGEMVVQQRFHLAEVTGILLLQTPGVASLDDIEHGIKLVLFFITVSVFNPGI